MAELLSKQVLFSGDGEIAQINKIFAMLGTPSEDSWPGYKSLKIMQQVPDLVKACFQAVHACTLI